MSTNTHNARHHFERAQKLAERGDSSASTTALAALAEGLALLAKAIDAIETKVQNFKCEA